MIRRGRLRMFDVDWAVRQALHEFWLHGYAGTTLTKLKAVIRVAFARSRAPYSRLMTRKLIRQFVTPNRETLSHLPSLAALESAQSLDEFHRHLYECAGYISQQAFLDGCNPVQVMEKVAIPLLVLNAEDDPVCVMGKVHDHQQAMARMPKTVLAITARGSHCAYLAGLTARSWAHYLAADYLKALHRAVCR